MKLLLVAAAIVGGLALASGEGGSGKQVHLFEGAKNAWAMTYDKTGKILPQDYAPWQHVKSFERSDPRFKFGKDEKDLAEVDAKGYSISIIAVSISR